MAAATVGGLIPTRDRHTTRIGSERRQRHQRASKAEAEAEAEADKIDGQRDALAASEQKSIAGRQGPKA